MRIRQVKPAYWADPLLHKKLTADERECYIGLWGFADDAGWLRLDLAEIAGELYRYRPTDSREADLQTWVDHLEALGRIEVFACGHAFIPTLTKHQRMAAETRKVFAIRNEHGQNCNQRIAAEHSEEQPTSPLERNVKERNVKEPSADLTYGPEVAGRTEMIGKLLMLLKDPTTSDMVRSKVTATLRRLGVDAAERRADDDQPREADPHAVSEGDHPWHVPGEEEPLPDGLELMMVRCGCDSSREHYNTMVIEADPEAFARWRETHEQRRPPHSPASVRS